MTTCLKPFLLAGLVVLATLADAQAKVTLTVKENNMGGVLPGIKAETLRISADVSHVAYVAAQGGKQLVVLDGKPSPAYDEIVIDNVTHDSLVFSPDSRHLVYSAEKDGQWFVVIDGKSSPAYDKLLVSYHSKVFASMVRFGGVGGFLSYPSVQVPKCRPAPRFFTSRQTLMPERDQPHFYVDGSKHHG
jgi:hypothetical protein